MEHVLREVNSGWFLRFLHSNGASFFFYCGLFTSISCFFVRLIFLTTLSFMNFWCYYFFVNDGCSVYGLCFTVRTDELLRGDRYY